MTRFAIVGAGGIGVVHGQACLRLPGVAVTWVIDQDEGRAASLAHDLGAKATSDIAEAVSASDVDAVIVAVPTPFHRPVTELAATRGKHVFCEKPMARTMADADAMITACQSAGVRLMIGQVVRFFPEYVRIKELLDQGALGKVGIARASRVNHYPRSQQSWFLNLEESGGVIVDFMIHDIDTLRWYFGDVARVYAHGLSFTKYQRTTDHAVALLRFVGGEIAHVEASWAHSSFRTALEIAGEHGTIRQVGEETAPIRLERAIPDSAQQGVITRRNPLGSAPYEAELRHFVDRLADGEPFLTDAEEGKRSLSVALAVLESVRTGRPVHLGEVSA